MLMDCPNMNGGQDFFKIFFELIFMLVSYMFYKMALVTETVYKSQCNIAFVCLLKNVFAL